MASSSIGSAALVLGVNSAAMDAGLSTAGKRIQSWSPKIPGIHVPLGNLSTVPGAMQHAGETGMAKFLDAVGNTGRFGRIAATIGGLFLSLASTVKAPRVDIKVNKPKPVTVDVVKPAAQTIPIVKPARQTIDVKPVAAQTIPIVKPARQYIEVVRPVAQTIPIVKPAKQIIPIVKPAPVEVITKLPRPVSIPIAKLLPVGIPIKKPAPVSIKTHLHKPDLAPLATLPDEAGQVGQGMLSNLTGALGAAGPWGAAIAAIVAGIGAIGAGIGAVIATNVALGWERAKDITSHARMVGMPTEEFSGLAYAANIAGVSLEDLGKTLTFVEHTMYKAEHGADGTKAKMQSLGLDLDKMSKMTTAEKLGEIGDALNRLKPSDRLGAATDLFGERKLHQVMPLLQKGKAGITDMVKEAEKLGITFDSAAAGQLNKFKNVTRHLQTMWQGVWNKIAVSAAPALAGFASQIESVIPKIVNVVGPMVSWISNAISTNASDWLVLFEEVGSTVSEVFGDIKSAFSGFDFGDIGLSWSDISKSFIEQTRNFTLVFVESKDIIKNAWVDVMEFIKSTLAKILDFAATAIDTLATGVDKIPGMGKQAESLHGFAQSAREAKEKVDALKTPIKVDVDADISRLKARFAELDAAKAKAANQEIIPPELIEKANKLFAEDPLVKYGEKLQDLREMLRFNLITMQEFTAQSKKAHDELLKSVGIEASPLEEYKTHLDKLQEAFQSGKINSDEFARGIDQATRNLEKGLGDMKSTIPGMLAGSKEAQHVILANTTKTDTSPQARLQRALDQQTELQRQQVQQGTIMIQELRKRGELAEI